MLLVVFGHFIEPINNIKFFQSVYQFIYIIHMPAFVFISGYFAKKGVKFNDAFSKYLIPFFVFQLISVALNSLFGLEHPANSASGFFLFPVRVLWYLVSLFFWTMILNLINEKYLKHLLLISAFLFPIISGIVPGTSLTISRTLYFFPFFFLGYYTRVNELNWVFNANKTIKVVCSVFLAGLLILCTVVLVDRFILYGNYHFAKSGLNLMSGSLLRSSIIVLSFLSCFALFNLVPKRTTFYSDFGAKTFPIFLFHDIVVQTFVHFGFLKSLNGIWLALTVIAATLFTYLLTSLNFFGEILLALRKPQTKLKVPQNA